MRTTFIYLNKCVININILKLKKVDFSESENEFYYGTEGVYESSVENILTIKFVSV